MEAGYQIPVTALVLIGLMLAFTVVTTVMFRKQKTSADYYLAGRKVNSFINASAISSDYLSAASFLGVAGVAFLFGFDGIIYALGFFVGYIALLLFLASPLRKFGRYTVPDFVSERFPLQDGAHPGRRGRALHLALLHGPANARRGQGHGAFAGHGVQDGHHRHRPDHHRLRHCGRHEGDHGQPAGPVLDPVRRHVPARIHPVRDQGIHLHRRGPLHLHLQGDRLPKRARCSTVRPTPAHHSG